MRKIVAVLALLALSACERYESVTSRYVVSNPTNLTVVLVVEGGEKGPDIGPGGSTNFNVKTTLPRPRCTSCGYGGPTDVPPTANYVSVQFRIRSTGELTRSRECWAGEGVVTHAELQVYGSSSYVYYDVNCWYDQQQSYNRAPIKAPLP